MRAIIENKHIIQFIDGTEEGIEVELPPSVGQEDAFFEYYYDNGLKKKDDVITYADSVFSNIPLPCKLIINNLHTYELTSSTVKIDILAYDYLYIEVIPEDAKYKKYVLKVSNANN